MFEIDDVIPFVRREEHKGKTIRQIIRYDSGYLKDLFVKDSRVVFSEKCMKEILRLTAGHFDNWESPQAGCTNNIFSTLKTYRSPYLFDFNKSEIENENNRRLANLEKERCE